MLLIVGPHHEAWFDEAQAWLIARDDSPWRILATAARHEGSPALWHLVVWLAQRMGLAYAQFWTLSCALAFGGAVVVMLRAPFPLWLRAGVVFSYFVAYQFAIVARSYSLDVLLIPLAAWCWTAQRERPVLLMVLLGLLGNTNAHCLILAGALAAQYAWNNRSTLIGLREVKAWTPLLVFAAFAVAAVLQAWPSPDVRFPLADDAEPLRAALLLKEALINRADFLSFGSGSGLSQEIGILLSAIALAPVAALCYRAGLGVAFFLGVGAFLAFSALKFADGWHAGLLFLYLVALLWMAWSRRSTLARFEQIWLAASLAVVTLSQAVGTAGADWAGLHAPYSGAPAAARAIAAQLQTHPSDRVGAIGTRTITLQPWFRHNIFANHVSGAPAPAYYLWSTAETLPHKPTPKAWRDLLAQGDDLVVLGEVDQADPNTIAGYTRLATADGYRLIGMFPGSPTWRGAPTFNDSFYLYGLDTRPTHE